MEFQNICNEMVAPFFAPPCTVTSFQWSDNSNRICYRPRKSRKFYTPPVFSAPAGVTPSEFRKDLDIHKTRMNELSCGEESLTIYSAVLIQCQRVTDGQTDRQTDVQPISITCFSIADARKKRFGYKDKVHGNWKLDQPKSLVDSKQVETFIVLRDRGY